MYFMVLIALIVMSACGMQEKDLIIQCEGGESLALLPEHFHLLNKYTCLPLDVLYTDALPLEGISREHIQLMIEMLTCIERHDHEGIKSQLNELCLYDLINFTKTVDYMGCDSLLVSYFIPVCAQRLTREGMFLFKEKPQSLSIILKQCPSLLQPLIAGHMMLNCPKACTSLLEPFLARKAECIYSGSVYATAFSCDGSKIAIAGKDWRGNGLIDIYNVSLSKPKRELRLKEQNDNNYVFPHTITHAVCFTGDGEYLMTSNSEFNNTEAIENWISCWSLVHKKKLFTYTMENFVRKISSGVSKDSFLTWNRKMGILLHKEKGTYSLCAVCQAGNNEEKHNHHQHVKELIDMHLDQHGDYALTVQKDGISIWNVADAVKRFCSYILYPDQISSVDFDEKSQRIAVGTAVGDVIITLYNHEDYSYQHTARLHVSDLPFNVLRIFCDDTIPLALIATSHDSDQNVKIIDLMEEKEICSLPVTNIKTLSVDSNMQQWIASFKKGTSILRKCDIQKILYSLKHELSVEQALFLMNDKQIELPKSKLQKLYNGLPKNIKHAYDMKNFNKNKLNGE